MELGQSAYALALDLIRLPVMATASSSTRYSPSKSQMLLAGGRWRHGHEVRAVASSRAFGEPPCASVPRSVRPLLRELTS